MGWKTDELVPLYIGKAGTPQLKRPVHFWAMAWDWWQVGVWEDLGPTPLAFLEYLMIGVASFVSPNLLNREGIGRGR